MLCAVSSASCASETSSWVLRPREKRSDASWKASWASREFCWRAAKTDASAQQLGARARDLERHRLALQLELQLGDAHLRLRDVVVRSSAKPVEDREAEIQADLAVGEQASVLTDTARRRSRLAEITRGACRTDWESRSLTAGTPGSRY